jgi:uncharacterized protein
MTERIPTAPPQNADSQPFYEAAATGRFIGRRCTGCKKYHWYPRPYCPFCSKETEWVELSGNGVVYSYSVMRRVPAPYAIAYVTLAEGPTMMTNIVGCDLDSIRIGQSVKVLFTASDGAQQVPCFTPS